MLKLDHALNATVYAEFFLFCKGEKEPCVDPAKCFDGVAEEAVRG